MKMRRLTALALFAALAACGTASDAVTFRAPPGFTQAASIGPFVEVWNTADKQSILTLMALPAKIDLQNAMSQSNIQDAQVKLKQNVKICGNQQAIFADIVGASKTATTGQAPHKMNIEFLATNIHEKTYMAVYMRPLNAPVDAAADRAIRNICPK